MSSYLNLEEIKAEASLLVQKVRLHPSISPYTKQAFESALHSLDTAGTLQTFSAVAALALPIVSACNECAQLKLELETLKRRVSGYERREIAAVRRQIAINIEFIAKTRCLELLGEIKIDENDAEKRREVRACVAQSRLHELLNRLDDAQKKIVLDLFYQDDSRSFLNTIFHMKAFSSDAEHPTTLFDEAVTEELALKIVSETVAHREAFEKVPSEKEMENVRHVAKMAVIGLAQYRINIEHYDKGETLLLPLM